MGVLDNLRHERFAQALASGKSATEAMAEAGLKDARNSTRLTKNDEIRKRVEELQGRVVEGIILSRQWVIEGLIDNVRRSKDAQAVLDSKGKQTGEFKYDGTVANRALELLGKEIGMFVDRTENTNINYDVTAEPLSPEQWAEQHATTH